MNPDIALSVELTKQRQSQADTLRQVVKVLVEKNNLQGLEEATSSIGKTPLTNFETIIQDLENEWKAYQLPFHLTIKDFHCCKKWGLNLEWLLVNLVSNFTHFQILTD